MFKKPAGGMCRFATGLMAALLLAVPLSPAHATEPEAQLAQAQVDEPTMQAFVNAAKEIISLRQRYEPLLQKAESQEAAEKLVTEARGLMNTAITSSGMTVKEYTDIARTAQADPTLRARIEAAVGTQ